MFEWLKQRIISWLLSRYVGKWIQVEQKNLHGTTEGNVWTLVAEHLLLKNDCLEDIDLPFSVRSGTVEKLSVRWEDKQSLKIHVDTIFVCLESRKGKVLSVEMQKDKEVRAKLAELEHWDAKLDHSLSPSSEEDTKGKDDGAAAYRALLDKLEVTISNIHICYYDSSTCHTFGAHIEEITLRNLVGKDKEQTFKSADVKGLALYIDAAEPPTDPASAKARAHTYILNPMSAHTQISYDHAKSKLDVQRPKIALEATVPELSVSLRRHQYFCVMSFLDFLSNRQRLVIARPGRPESSPSDAPAEWWAYLLNNVRREVNDRLHRRTAAFHKERRKKRLEYVDLYIKRRRDELKKKEAKVLDALEEELPFQDIVFFRCTAIRRMQASPEKMVQRKKRTWGEWFAGKKKPEEVASEDVSEHGDSNEHGEIASLFQNLSSEERESLFSAENAGVHGYGSLTKSENLAQVMFSLTATLESVRLRLIDVGGKLDATASFTHAALGFVKRSNVFEVKAGLQSLLIHNASNQSTICQQAGVDEGDSENLMNIDISSDRNVSPCVNRVKIRVASLDLNIDPHVLTSLVHFWRLEDPGLDLAAAAKFASDAYSDVRGDVSRLVAAQAAATGAASNNGGEILELDVDIGAPNLFLHENAAKEVAAVVVFRLGHLTVRHTPVPEHLAEKRTDDSRPNRFAFAVENVGVDLIHGGVKRGSAAMNASVVRIVEDTRLDAAFDVSLPLKRTGEDERGGGGSSGIGISAYIQHLDVGISQESISEVVRIVTSWGKTKGVFKALERAPKIAGRVLVKGISGVEDDWCWRYLALHSSSVVCRVEEGGAADAFFSLADYVVLRSKHQGANVIALRPIHNQAVEEGDVDDGSRDLLIFAGREIDMWMLALGQEQRAINPFLNPDTARLSSPGELLVSKGVEGRRGGGVKTVVVMSIAAARAVLRGEEGNEIVVLRVGDVNMKSTNAGHAGVRSELMMKSLEVIDMQIKCSPEHVLQRDENDEEDGPCLSFSTERGGRDGGPARTTIGMAAIGVVLSPGIVRVLRNVQAGAVREMQRAQGGQRGGQQGDSEADTGGDGRGAWRVPSADEVRSPGGSLRSPRDSIADSVGSLEQYTVGVRSLREDDVPKAWREGGRAERECGLLCKVLEFEAVGLTVKFKDEENRPFAEASMSNVQVTQEGRGSRGKTLRGTLGSLEVKDVSCAGNINQYFLSATDRSSGEALVTFELQTPDPTTLTSCGAPSSIKVGINRPQMTLMVRFIAEIGHYFRSFAPSSDPPASVASNAASAAASLEPLSEEVDGDGGIAAPARPRSIIEIELQHPVLVFPRSSRSTDAWSTDLGRIHVKSLPEGGWDISFESMKLETMSEAGGRSVMTKGVNGRARVEPPGGGNEAGLKLSIDIVEVVGCITDMQYNLLFSIIGQNVGESRKGRLGGRIERLSGGDSAGLSFERLKELCELSAAAAMDTVPRIEVAVTVATTRIDISIAKDLDTAPEDRLALLRASCVGLKVEYDMLPPSQEPVENDARDGLFWRFKVILPELTMVDNRPEMQARALSLLSTKAFQDLVGSESPGCKKHDGEGEVGCFCLEFNKTRQFHADLNITAKPIEAVADAGIFFSFLDWISQGARAFASLVPKVDEFRYVVLSPGGFQVTVSLDDARLHFVTSFEDAEADAFIVEGAIRVGYAHASGRCQFYFGASGLQLISHRSCADNKNSSMFGSPDRSQLEGTAYFEDEDDQFADPEWQDRAVLSPSNAKFVYSWRVPGSISVGDNEPASMSLHLSDSTLKLTHDDAMMLGTVYATLMMTLRNRPGAPPPPPKPPPRPDTDVVLTISVEIPSIDLSLGARHESSSLMEICLRGLQSSAHRLAGGKFEATGQIVACDLIDDSVSESMHRHILAVKEASELIRFEYTIFPPGQEGLDGEKSKLRVTVNRPQISVVMRFIREMTEYLGSFEDLSRSRSIKAATPQSAASKPLTRFDIDLMHPVLVLPRSSRSGEAYVADLGRMRVSNSRSEDGKRLAISLQAMRLETLSEGGHRSIVIPAVDVSAKVFMPFVAAGMMGHGIHPAVCVDVDASLVEATMTDCQYALLLSIFAENFAESRVRNDRPGQGNFTETFAPGTLEDQGDVLESLATCLDKCSANSKDTALSARYVINVAGVHLNATTAQNLDAADGAPLARAVASKLQVHYEVMDPLSHDVAHGSDVQLWRCRAGFRDIVIYDARDGLENVSGKRPFLAAKPRVEEKPVAGWDAVGAMLGKAHSEDGMEDAIGDGFEDAASDFEDDDKDGDGVQHFVLEFNKCIDMHMGLTLTLKQLEGIADAGLLLGILGLFARGGGQKVPSQVGSLKYNLISPGGFLCTTLAPVARIHLVDSFTSHKPNGFVTESSLECFYANNDGQFTLRVDLKEFGLTSHSSARPASNSRMQIVKPCLLSYTQKWKLMKKDFGSESGYSHKGSASAPLVTTNLEMYAQAADFSAMVTYEDTLLGMQVMSCLVKSMKERTKQPPPSPSSSSNANKEAPASRPERGNGGKIGVFGMNISFTFVDDYGGRWIPLLRLTVPNIWVSGTSGSTIALETKVRAYLDYFHNSTSTWRAALEPWDIGLQYVYHSLRETGAHTELNISSPDDIATVHVSSAIIDSLTRAVSTWDTDRRTYALLTSDSDSPSTPPLTPIAGLKKSSPDRTPQTPDRPSPFLPVQPNAAHPASFVPYSVHNFLAERLLCILEDGSEYTLDPNCVLELTYEQVWRRRGALQIFARDQNLNAIENSVCLQVEGTQRVFCKASLEIERSESYVLKQNVSSTVEEQCPLSLVCDLSQRDGQKILGVSSMVTVRNCCAGHDVDLCVVDPDGTDMVEIGTVRAGGALALPLHHARSGTLCFRAAGDRDREFEWSNGKEEGVSLQQLHDGTIMQDQQVDGKFLKIFAGLLPVETRLLGWYVCANDVDGVLRQGALYVTSNAVCHYSNIMGGERKDVIFLNSITSIAKCTTAFVFPNAISITTKEKTYYFRTLLNRGEVFRLILSLLPKDVAKVDDDVDERARRLFKLEPSDVITSVHSCSWHHEPKITDGHVLLTRRHVCFMGNSENRPALIKFPWNGVNMIEKKKSFVVRSNAVLITTSTSELFLSSSRWNRDKVFEEEMGPLWRAESNLAAARNFRTNAEGAEAKSLEDVDKRCRTITCRVKSRYATSVRNDPKDQNQVYVRQKARSADSFRWVVVIKDAVSLKRGPERRAGGPALIELHPPWVVENLSATPLEFQLIDQRQSVIAQGRCEQGEVAEVLSIGLKREVHFRVRVADGPRGKPNQWCSAMLLNASGARPELDAIVDLADSEGGGQPVHVEVQKHHETQGFRVRLYNRFWLCNVTGLRMQYRRMLPVGDWGSARVMPLGVPFGFDLFESAETTDLQVKLDGFEWSNTFPIGRQEAESLSIQLKMSPAKAGTNPVLPNSRVTIDVTMSTATGKFDRTSIVSFTPQIIVENRLPEAVVVWQRATQATEFRDAKRPTVWLEPGKAMPFYPEGDRRHCRLSVNVASEDTSSQCAAFAPVKQSQDRVLLSCSDGRVVMTHTEHLETGACLVIFDEPRGVMPHTLRNHTELSLGFLQKDSPRQMLLNVPPGGAFDMVWPDPLFPKVLVLASINGVSVRASTQVDLDNLETPITPLYSESHAMLVQKIISQVAPQESSKTGSKFALRLCLPAGTDMKGMSPPGLIELSGAVVVGRNPGNVPGAKSVAIDCGPASEIVSRQHLRLQPVSGGGDGGDWEVVDLSSTNGVVVNGTRVLRHTLQSGDVLTIGGAHGVGVGQRPVEAMSPFVYMFEAKGTSSQDVMLDAVVGLRATMVLESGTKVMHVTVGELPEGLGGGASKLENSGGLTLRTRGISVLLEDDTNNHETREILHMMMEDVHVVVETNQTHRQLTASVMQVQLDNQYDSKTHFPVVISIAPHNKTAVKLSLVEKRAHPGVERYFNHVVFECGDPFIFIEDKLLSVLAKFGRSIRDRRDPSKAGVAARALHEHAAVAGQQQSDKGVPEKVSRMVDIVVRGTGTASDNSLNRTNGGKGGGKTKHGSPRDGYVYCDDLKLRGWSLHLSLMFTGNSDDVRRYVGPVVQRMLRKVRVDDVVVKIPELNKTRLYRTKKNMTRYVTERYVKSIKKSFLSTKFLLKGLDAWSDSWFGQQSEGQKAGARRLRRLRALQDDFDHVSGSFKFDQDGSLQSTRSNSPNSSFSKETGFRSGVTGAMREAAGIASHTAQGVAGMGVGVAAKATVSVATVGVSGLGGVAGVAGKGASAAVGAASGAVGTAASGLKKVGMGLFKRLTE